MKSSAATLSQYIITTVVLVCLVVGISITIISNKILSEHFYQDEKIFLKYFSDTQFDMASRQISKQYLLLLEYAQHSLIVSALTQVDPAIMQRGRSYLEKVAKSTESYLTLLDFEGEAVHSTIKENLYFEYQTSRWVHDILVAGKGLHLKIVDIEGSRFIELAVPVLYNRAPEGVLVNYLPVNAVLGREKGESKTLSCTLQNLDKDKSDTLSSEAGEDKLPDLQRRFFEWGISLNCQRKLGGDHSLHQEISFYLLGALLLMILLSLLVMMIMLKVFFISPLSNINNWLSDHTLSLRDFPQIGGSWPFEVKELISNLAQFVTRSNGRLLKALDEIHVYQLTMHLGSESVMITTVDGDIRYVNPAMSKILGWEREELELKNITDCFSGGGELLAQLLQQTELKERETTVTSFGNEKKQVKVNASLLFDRSGKNVNYLRFAIG